MSKKLYPEEDIQAIANAIRALNGSSDTYTVGDMADAIEMPDNAYYLKETEASNPLVITDGEELNAQSCVVEFEPIQDLHGYENPWPAGGNKNKCPEFPYPYAADNNFVEYPTAITFHGITLSFTFSGSFSNRGAAFIVGYDENNSPAYSYAIHNWVKVSDGTAIEENVTYTKERFRFSISNSVTVNIKKFVLTNYPSFSNDTKFENVQIEEGSTLTDFVPYSNICPISGRDSLDLYQSKGNSLIDYDLSSLQTLNTSGTWNGTEYTYNGVVYNYDKKISFSGTASSNSAIKICDINLPANTYKLSGINGGSDSTYRLRYRFDGGGFQYLDGGNISFTFVNTKRFELWVFVPSGAEVDSEAYPFLSNTDDTISIKTATFPNTVYGGKLDFVSGVGAREYSLVIYDGTENWLAVSDAPHVFYISIFSVYQNESILKCNKYKGLMNGSSNSMNNNEIRRNRNANNLLVRDDRANTVDEFKALCVAENIRVVYYRNTPTTITLTPETIALLKDNNVFATDGKTVKVRYLSKHI